MKMKAINLMPQIKAPRFADKNIGPEDRHELMNKQQQRYQTCVHEAAHAVFTYCMTGALERGGCEVNSWDEGDTSFSLSELEPADDAVVTMAGATAELVWLGHPSHLTRTHWETWYETERHYTTDMGQTDSQIQLKAAEKLRPDDKYGIMGEWDGKVNQMLKDPVIWTAIIGVANKLYAEQGLDAEQVERIIMRIVKHAQAAGFPEPTKHNRLLYDLRNNFTKFIQARRAQRPSWEIDIEDILAMRTAAAPK